MRRIHVLGAIALVIFTGPMLAAPALQTSAEARQILPRTLVPSHYDLSLMANPEALTFKGDVQITSTSPTGGRQIVMNAKGLTFDEVRLDGRLGGAVTLDDELGRATITFPSAFAAGRHTLSIAYHGPITTGTIGFFAMDYDTPSGKRRTLATNFEPGRGCGRLDQVERESEGCGASRHRSLDCRPGGLTWSADRGIRKLGIRDTTSLVAVLHQEIPDAVLRLLPIRSCSIRRFAAQRGATTLRASLEGRA